VIQHHEKAHKKWQDKISRAFYDKKIDRAEACREYALATIIDWNGETDFSLSSSAGGELVQHLKRYAGIVTSINSAAAELAGAYTEARKS
jgi:hypothetical protein